MQFGNTVLCPRASTGYRAVARIVCFDINGSTLRIYACVCIFVCVCILFCFVFFFALLCFVLFYSVLSIVSLPSMIAKADARRAESSLVTSSEKEILFLLRGSRAPAAIIPVFFTGLQPLCLVKSGPFSVQHTHTRTHTHTRKVLKLNWFVIHQLLSTTANGALGFWHHRQI